MSRRDQDSSRADGGSHRGGAGYLLSHWLLGGLLLATGLASFSLPAQTNTVTKAAPSNRCLLIVDTSRSMQRCTDATLKVVQDLLMSGLDGQLRRGDTLGLWTFNQDLYAGRFPLQAWSSEGQGSIATRAVAFLKAQKYEKRANFDKVLPALTGIIKGSERITVILISSGDESIQGTPFDDRINEVYKRLHNQQQKARMPFVTVLRAQNGRLADFAVNTPPWPLQIPPPPRETQTVETPQHKLREALHKAQSTGAPPLIVSGKKPEPEKVPEPKPEPVPGKPEAPAPVMAAGSTNQPVVIQPPEPSAAAAQVAKAASAPAVPEPPATQMPSKPPPAPTPVAKPEAKVVKPSDTKPVETVPSKSEAAPLLPSPTTTAQPATNEQPTPPLAPEPKSAAAPIVPPKQGVSSETASNATAAAAVPAHSASPAAMTPSRPTPPAQTATAAPVGSLASHKTLWIAAPALAVVAVGLFFLLRRRSRPAPQGSLITRSFEREKEP